MSWAPDGGYLSDKVEDVDRDQRAARRRIASEISRIGPVLPGTLLERRLTCTKRGCRCHADPPQLHGPYWYWTRKVNAKTVTRMLSAEQAVEYRRWIDNQHEVRRLLHELEQIAIDAVEADPRTPRRKRTSATPPTVDKG